eukprot:1194882-Prorocentrum_minimum.AAC.3
MTCSTTCWRSSGSPQQRMIFPGIHSSPLRAPAGGNPWSPCPVYWALYTCARCFIAPRRTATFLSRVRCATLCAHARGDGKGYDVDGKGYDVDGKGYNVDGKGYDVDGKGYDVDGKGYDVDDEDTPMWMLRAMIWMASGRTTPGIGARRRANTERTFSGVRLVVARVGSCSLPSLPPGGSRRPVAAVVRWTSHNPTPGWKEERPYLQVVDGNYAGGGDGDLAQRGARVEAHSLVKVEHQLVHRRADLRRHVRRLTLAGLDHQVGVRPRQHRQADRRVAVAEAPYELHEQKPVLAGQRGACDTGPPLVTFWATFGHTNTGSV